MSISFEVWLEETRLAGGSPYLAYVSPTGAIRDQRGVTIGHTGNVDVIAAGETLIPSAPPPGSSFGLAADVQTTQVTGIPEPLPKPEISEHRNIKIIAAVAVIATVIIVAFYSLSK